MIVPPPPPMLTFLPDAGCHQMASDQILDEQARRMSEAQRFWAMLLSQACLPMDSGLQDAAIGDEAVKSGGLRPSPFLASPGGVALLAGRATDHSEGLAAPAWSSVPSSLPLPLLLRCSLPEHKSGPLAGGLATKPAQMRAAPQTVATRTLQLPPWSERQSKKVQISSSRQRDWGAAARAPWSLLPPPRRRCIAGAPGRQAAPVLEPASASGSTPAPLFVVLEDGGYTFTLTLRKADGVELGLSTTHVKGSRNAHHLIVTDVATGGAIDSWNRQCVGGPRAGKVVAARDRIICVNGASDVDGMLWECTQKVLLKMTVLRCADELFEGVDNNAQNALETGLENQ